MTTDEWRSFVGDGTRTAKFAVTRTDGRPHVTPTWVALEGDDVVMNTGEMSVKAQAIRRDPRVALLFDDERPPYAFVLIEGTATLSDDLAEVRRIATRLGGRYMGDDRAEEFGERNGVPGELAVRVRIDRVIARRDIAD
jgi:PPOX class probable F420-dependent enzyme